VVTSPRQSGRCVASAWQSGEAIRASHEQVRPIRDRAAEVFAGSPQVEEWEIAVLSLDHRSREGACVRAMGMQVEPVQVDLAIDVFKMASLPAFEDLEGFRRASMLIDRASGRTVSSVTYDSLEAMEPEQGAGRGGQSGAPPGSMRRSARRLRVRARDRPLVCPRWPDRRPDGLTGGARILPRCY